MPNNCTTSPTFFLANGDQILKTGPMEQLLGSSITYRIAVGLQEGHKVFTLQTPPGL